MFWLQFGLEPPDETLGYCNSEIVVPIFLEGGKAFGAVFASTNHPNIHYGREQLDALTSFANQAAFTIRSYIQIKEANMLRHATAALAGPGAPFWYDAVQGLSRVVGGTCTNSSSQ